MRRISLYIQHAIIDERTLRIIHILIMLGLSVTIQKFTTSLRRVQIRSFCRCCCCFCREIHWIFLKVVHIKIGLNGKQTLLTRHFQICVFKKKSCPCNTV
ncbi:hypothetical protein BD408DRAFT_154615 [Parasitella parasitica]|nr:hypothetical protein BD408DRAFT_154615 [Parasitella parasitica]